MYKKYHEIGSFKYLRDLNDIYEDMKTERIGHFYSPIFEKSRFASELTKTGIDMSIYKNMSVPTTVLKTIDSHRLPSITVRHSNPGLSWSKPSTEKHFYDMTPISKYVPYFETTGRISDLAYLFGSSLECLRIEPNQKGNVAVDINPFVNTRSGMEAQVFIIDVGDGANVRIDEEISMDSSGFFNCLILYLIRPKANVTVSRRLIHTGKSNTYNDYNGYYMCESRILQFPRSTLSFLPSVESRGYIQDLYYLTVHRDSQTKFKGRYTLTGTRKSNNNVLVDVEHVGNDSKSDVDVKMALSGQAKGTFQGNIIVPPYVKDIESSLFNKNLIIDKDAAVFSEPKLDISNKNIICKHGAATKNISAADIYPFQSVGLGPDEATETFIQSFMQ